MTNLRLQNSYAFTIWVWSLIVVSLVGGCAAKDLPPYPTQAASSYPYFQAHDGLAIGIKPLTDPQESEKYFDTNLLSRDVLAIFVTAENQGAPGRFLLLRDGFKLQTAQKEEHPVSGHEQVESTTLKIVYKSLGVFGALLTAGYFVVPGVPIILGANKIQEHEEGVMRKFISEQLPFDAIFHDREIHGFVYFPRPPGYPGPGQWVLHLEVQNFDSKEVKVFDFILNEK